jgi:hypothetical protein
MSDLNVFFTIQFEDNAVSLQEAQELEKDLNEFGATRLRQYVSPASDVGTTLITIIEFVGQNAIAGLIGAGSLAIFERLKNKFTKFLRRDPKEIYRHRFFDRLVIRFDDLDVCIFMVDDKLVEQLPLILTDISTHLREFPLKDALVNEIFLPMERIGANWRTPSTVWSRDFPTYPFRYWRVASRSVIGAFGIYDTHQHVLIDEPISDDELLRVLLDSPHPIAVGKSNQLIQHISSIKSDANQHDLDKLARDVECLSYLLGIEIGDSKHLDFEMVKQLIQATEWLKSSDHPLDALRHLSKQNPP